MNIWEIGRIIIEVLLVAWALYERISASRDKEHIKSSLRVWQHQAKGLAEAIQRFSWASGASFLPARFTNIADVGVALDGLHEVAESMYQSLYESRFFTDAELKENMKKDKEKEEAAKLIQTAKSKKRIHRIKKISQRAEV